MFFKYFYLFLFGSCATFVNSSKILCLFPSPSPSHLIVAKALMTGLAERGHDVTVVSSFPLDIPMKNYRDIYIPHSEEIKRLITTEMVKTAGNKLGFLKNVPKITQMTVELANNTLNSPEFQKLMNEESFDLMILGAFANNFLLGVGAHFNCPIAVLSTVGNIAGFNELVGNPTEISYVPHLFLGVKDVMNFQQRLKNIFIRTIEIISSYFMENKFKYYYNTNFPPTRYPSYDEMKKNVSLVLVNSHFTQGNPCPFVPAMIEIGGIQCKENATPLPEDIKEWIESAKHGAIFFSMGSNVRSADLNPEILNSIIKTFSKLKQNILWKYEIDEHFVLPKNVKIWKWLPQDDILRHSNLKLFITHGGMGSIIEAKYHGVPIVSIPVYGDQMTNSEIAVKEGWAIIVQYFDLTEELFFKTIQEILTNSKYKAAVTHWSELYRDRPTTAKELANYWIEYVIRHHGAKHMQSYAVHLNFFQVHSFDTIGFILLVLFIVLKINLFVFKFCLKLLCKKNVKSKSE